MDKQDNKNSNETSISNNNQEVIEEPHLDEYYHGSGVDVDFYEDDSEVSTLSVEEREALMQAYKNQIPSGHSLLEAYPETGIVTLVEVNENSEKCEENNEKKDQ